MIYERPFRMTFPLGFERRSRGLSISSMMLSSSRTISGGNSFRMTFLSGLNLDFFGISDFLGE